MEKLRIIVGGYIGLYPTGGATWDYIQYPLGLQLLGHDVYYIEDTKQYPIYQQPGCAWNDASVCVNYLKTVMDEFGLSDRWAYRDVASGFCYGLSEERVQELCKSADVFINISCSTLLRDEYLRIPQRILIDTDPMFTQMQYAMEVAGEHEATVWSTKYMIENHSHLFTFGENIGAVDCKIPLCGSTWLTTRQPVCVEHWSNKNGGRAGTFTSIMNWSGRKKLAYANELWGQKDVEFLKFKSVPLLAQQGNFEVVVNKPLNKESLFDTEELNAFGWTFLPPKETVSTIADYKNYILNSWAEFGVAKETYVKSGSGWFSCRSACYLASGKPVVTEETGWSKFIPSGEGLFSFSNTEEAIEAIESIQNNYQYHSKKAKALAFDYFDSNQVLTRLLQQLN